MASLKELSRGLTLTLGALLWPRDKLALLGLFTLVEGDES